VEVTTVVGAELITRVRKFRLAVPTFFDAVTEKDKTLLGRRRGVKVLEMAPMDPTEPIRMSVLEAKKSLGSAVVATPPLFWTLM
jgi:hypothetical protein